MSKHLAAVAAWQDCINKILKKNTRIVEKRLEYIGALQNRGKRAEGPCNDDLGPILAIRPGHECLSDQQVLVGGVPSTPNYGEARAKAQFASREDGTLSF
ncbi:hypothetical protein MRX96_054507 [Rhipicephalus microplus]